MIRGTTPEHYFSVNVDLSSATELYITYSQNGKPIIEKKIDDATITEDTITVNLTQEDTLKLKERDCQIQIRVKLLDGTAIASNIITTNVLNILKDGEI